MGELTVIRWRDIPMQVVGRSSDGKSARTLLSDRFQEAVDAAAMVAGLINSDDYTAQMAMDRRDVGDASIQELVDAEAERIEGAWSDDRLRAAIRTGGTVSGQDPT
jgi:hypothetical protein